jgi:hypothetical protein
LNQLALEPTAVFASETAAMYTYDTFSLLPAVHMVLAYEDGTIMVSADSFIFARPIAGLLVHLDGDGITSCVKERKVV